MEVSQDKQEEKPTGEQPPDLETGPRDSEPKLSSREQNEAEESKGMKPRVSF